MPKSQSSSSPATRPQVSSVDVPLLPRAIGRPEGVVKMIGELKRREFLGAHVVGRNATELIHALRLARQTELPSGDVIEMIPAHPTLSQAVMEAIRFLDGQPIHLRVGAANTRRGSGR
jgi:hypothetical protein